MELPAALVSDSEFEAALASELASPPQALPPDSVYPAFLGRQSDVAGWIADRVRGTFFPTPEETVGVNKGRHGLRPVAVWDIPSRILYRALTAQLEAYLAPLTRSRSAWQAFQRSPLAATPKYIVAADIAACYQHIDHGLMSQEMVIQTGEHEVLAAITALLRETSGRTYGLPQQSHASDVLAETFLARLERSLVRRGLQVHRYNDDFRVGCETWSEVVRSLEVLEEETRLVGLSVNDVKTITWKRAKYEKYLDEVDRLRQEIADEAELDLTEYDTDSYGQTVVVAEPEEDDVELLLAMRVLERWQKVAGRGNVATSRRAEHRAVLELLPYSLATLGAVPGTLDKTLDGCNALLRFERTLTPAVGKYLSTRTQDEDRLVTAFDRLLKSKAYLNGWQTWWLQQPVARLSDFAKGTGSKKRVEWAHAALTSAEHTPVLRAEAARTLARHKQIKIGDLLSIYDRSSETVRPVLCAAMALLKPNAQVRAAVTGDSQLNEWVYDWAALLA